MDMDFSSTDNLTLTKLISTVLDRPVLNDEGRNIDTAKKWINTTGSGSALFPLIDLTLDLKNGRCKKATPKIKFKFQKKRKSVKKEPISPIRSPESTTPTRSAACGSRKRPAATATGGAGPSSSPRSRFEEDENNGDNNEPSEDEGTNNNRNNNRQNGSENRDPQPQVDLTDDDMSRDSQDSQELGMPYDDFKLKLMKNVMEKYSNAEYLEAQHFTRELKAKSQKKWNKWTMGNPKVSMMIVDLFEI